MAYYLIVFIIFILPPLITILTVLQYPVYIIVIGAIWVILSLSVCVISGKKGARGKGVAIIICISIIFAAVCSGVYTKNEYEEMWTQIMIYGSDVKSFFFFLTEGLPVMTLVCIPSLIFWGITIEIEFEVMIRKAEDEMRNGIKAMLEEKVEKIAQIKKVAKLNDLSYLAIKHLIVLISTCALDKELAEKCDRAFECTFVHNIYKFEGLMPEKETPDTKDEFEFYMENLLKKEEEYKLLLNDLNLNHYKSLKRIYHKCKKK